MKSYYQNCFHHSISIFSFGAWVGTGNNWCSPYIPWQKVYNNDPEKLLEAQGVNGTEAKKLILGSEATLWTEQADDQSVENR